jgi:hypothetical protein
MLAAGTSAAPALARVAAGLPRTAATTKPLQDPAHNVIPGPRFRDRCSRMGTSRAANLRCDAAALRAFNAVRKSEGLGRMVLPRDFPSLSVPAQLLAITDIERVDRGLRPYLGESAALNKLALLGAKNDDDPPFPNPFPGTGASGNWAGAGNSALLDDFYWMYDDGPGSGNEDCPSGGGGGCWGHRHDILERFDRPLLMGAAVAYHTTWGTSMTELFIGGDRTDKVDVAPSWHRIAATFPLALAISANRTHAHSRQPVTITGRLHRRVTGGVVGHELVELQIRAGSDRRWQLVGRRRTGGHGVVRFTAHPTRSSAYRLVALHPSGGRDGASATVRVAVA